MELRFEDGSEGEEGGRLTRSLRRRAANRTPHSRPRASNQGPRGRFGIRPAAGKPIPGRRHFDAEEAKGG
jgi:hypothetical protein